MTVEIAGLTMAYGRRARILDGVDFHAAGGQLTGIMGPSGSGKSTLLYVVGLLLRPQSGRIVLDGIDVSRFGDWKRSRIRSEHVGFVFQDAALDYSRTVLDNVVEPTVYAPRRPRGRRERARQLLSSVGVELDPGRKPGQVSGGQAQRIGLCRALMTTPSIILADEPTGNLDDTNATVVIDLLRDAAAEGATVVVATHDPRVTERCDRVHRLA